MIKSRQITVQDDKFPNKEWRLGEGVGFCSFWCDATNCDKCIVRFQCLTSRDTISVAFPSDIVDKKIKEINAQHWRLRDGSSRFRTNR